MVKTKLLSLLLLLIALPQRIQGEKDIDNTSEASQSSTKNLEITTIKNIENTSEASQTVTKNPEITTIKNIENTSEASSTVAKIPQTTTMANIENASETLPTTTSVPNHISTDLIDLITYKPSEEEIVENGGHQISLPGGKNQGIRHVHAHDGFHNVKRERHWANWNNALKSKKTTEPSI